MESSEDKKRIANEKRLKAVQEWQKKRNQQNNTKPVHHSFVSPIKPKKIENKLELLNSDEDEDDDNEITFDIRPQFEGRSGQLLLEKNTEYSDRFKLDERFKLDDEESVVINENDEKVKNMKILESILGHEVGERYPEEKTSVKKRSILRFDPEDENSSKYIKKDEILEEKPSKKQQKLKEVSEDDTKDPIPTSIERYIEVNTNLKEILKSASSSPFSLTAKFNFCNDQADIKTNKDFNSSFTTSGKIPQHESRSKFSGRNETCTKPVNVFETKKKFTFFILENDARLKEGVKFFQIPKPIEEIRAEWDTTKDEVLDLLRKKRKTSQRGYVTKPNASQRNKQFAKNKKI